MIYLVQEFEQLEIDLKGLDWTGISGEKQIQNTQDLTNIVNTSPKMFDLDVGLGKLGKSEGNTIRLYETFPYASLELALPVVAHEAYQIYVGEDYYIQNIVDVERISWLIQTEVWEYARPVTQDYPSSSWFCTNCITPAPPLNEYDEEQIIAFNQNAWDTLQEGCMIKYRGLEKQREWIRDRGYGQ
jgi:hypothetical protein